MTVSAVPLFLFIGLRQGEWTSAFIYTVFVLTPVVALALVEAIDTGWTKSAVERIWGSHRSRSDIGTLEHRLDTLDLILSSETRRPWEPTVHPIKTASSGPKPVLLLPGADYHLPEMFGVADELEMRGIANVVAIGRAHWERTGDGLVWYDREVFEAPDPKDVPGRFSAVLTMKDWAGYGPLIETANDAGIPTFAKVEGAQDFHDVDTNQPRRPYRTAQHILCQGKNDYEALDGMPRTIVGSTRFERLWWAPTARFPQPLAVINLNFTYGVLTEARDLWLKTAIEGCELAGIPFAISVHPAEKARNPHPRATAVSASRLLRHATVLISRFSTLPYEAMARGVAFVYHNPHGERVPAFQDAGGAFPTSSTAGELSAALTEIHMSPFDVRTMSSDFFLSQVDVDPERPSETRSADVIMSGLPTL